MNKKSNSAKGVNSYDSTSTGTLIPFFNRNVSEYPTEAGGIKFDLVPVTKQKDLMINHARMYAQQEYDRIMQLVEVLDKQAQEIKLDMEKNKAPVGRDPRQANFTTPPKGKSINVEEIKVDVDEISSRSNDPRTQARKNYPVGFHIDAESNDSPPHIQAQYITKPPADQNKPVGTISRPSEGMGLGQNQINEEEDEGEYEEEEDEEELNNIRPPQSQGHYQQARIMQQQPAANYKPGPSQQLRNRPN